MRLKILGSAAGGGFPQWNCHCSNCQNVRVKSITTLSRTQSSIAISENSKKWILVNASPDIRKQLEDFHEAQQTNRLRDSGIWAIILTDSQIDHVAGLLSLREAEKLIIYCTEVVREELTYHFPLFEILKNYCVIECNRIHDSHVFTIQGFENLRLTPIDLPGKSPPYSPYRHTPKRGANTALMILDTLTQKTIFYAPAIAQWDEPLFQRMNNADCVLVDGTFWHDDEMSRTGINNKLAAEMGHCALAGEEGLLSHLNALQKPRKIVIHVNNTNPILNTTSSEYAQLNHANVEIAYDGMDILL
ncbi:pyrroloquinoline quinone biosynthesis protein PqqB [Rickettsiella grylli]|uniref:pyrroloquinoline quinone biosynthesis protein PqqB n=1 Tax=Rickettsiella grylli TaxID=59196 RepID=UPI0008FD3E04|nr:pyrroloquinoline quinone biosynthesis protein PqqB [Rickettsiella grylli]OJA00499.1 pyrroloquinoline quinone biosynthesis protein PqqB [Rickettsiella grylli]